MGAAILATTVLLLFSCTAIAMPETEDISCVTGLIDCQKYLGNTDTPTKTCCDPLKNAVKTQLKCLCNLLNDNELIKDSGINLAEVIKLPKRCGVSTDISVCKTVASSSNSTSAPKPKTASGNTSASAAASETAMKPIPTEKVGAGAAIGTTASTGVLGFMSFMIIFSFLVV